MKSDKLAGGNEDAEVVGDDDEIGEELRWEIIALVHGSEL